MNRSRLPEKQASLLLFLHEFRQRYGESPTLSMIVSGQSLASNRSVIDMLRSLVANGYLEPSLKISRCTKLTTKALTELGLLMAPRDVGRWPNKFATSTVVPPTSAQATWSDPGYATWIDPRQPNGTRSGSGADDIIRLLQNAVSELGHSGTASRLSTESGISTHPLVFLSVCSVAIVVIFGRGVVAAILFSVLMIILIRRLR